MTGFERDAYVALRAQALEHLRMWLPRTDRLETDAEKLRRAKSLVETLGNAIARYEAAEQAIAKATP